MNKTQINLLRFLLLVGGSIIMGIGIGLAISTGYGSDALSWLWQGITLYTPLTLNQANMLVAILFLIPPLLFDRSQLGIGSIIQPYVVGIITQTIVNSSLNLSGNLLMLIVATIIVGIGAGIYSSVNLGKMPYDASIFLVSRKYNLSLAVVKSVSDAIIFIIAWVLNKQLIIGPIVSVFIIGNVLNYTYNFMQKTFQKYQIHLNK
ncbi:hypothetical protein [Fundicoccus culcitae]|uniref:YitT family protein n=1 Tax=Fundicoccus culcitae TaxID=2969821 RepID=A0ABY5P8W5_9LACT|nr:hypothetical protein [Fundicoccus culcitae]UUX34910.1 hypothetical protein NRE15_04495 [Fundicoccus culcitae]